MAIIEHELVREGGEHEAPLCPVCGYLCEWMECETCDGEGGWYPHEISPIEYPDPDELSPCQICNGAGGWWLCPNPPAWCKANPALGGETPRLGL